MGILKRFRSIIGDGQQSEAESGQTASTSPTPSPRPFESSELSGESFDAAAARELFGSIAAKRAEPIKKFIVELRHGSVSKDWIEICLPVLGTLIDGAESLEIRSLQQLLLRFREALWVVQSQSGNQLDSDARHLVLPLYDELVAALPETFSIEVETKDADSIILHALLRQLPDVGLVTLEKLYAAGLTSLEAIYLASPEELESTTGVPIRLCRRICEKVQAHRQGREQSSDSMNPLAGLIEELKRQHKATEHDVSASGSRAASMRSRNTCVLQIDVVLAEMGQVDLVEELKALAVGRRVERLEEFLDSDISIANVQRSPAACDRD